MMIRQMALSVIVGETNAVVTNSPGVAPLASLAHSLGVFQDLDHLLPRKGRDRGLWSSAAGGGSGGGIADCDDLA